MGNTLYAKSCCISAKKNLSLHNGTNSNYVQFAVEIELLKRPISKTLAI